MDYNNVTWWVNISQSYRSKSVATLDYTPIMLFNHLLHYQQAIYTNFSVPNKREIQYELIMNIYEMF